MGFLMIDILLSNIHQSPLKNLIIS